MDIKKFLVVDKRAIGLVMAVFGLAVGTTLVSQRQLFSKKAATMAPACVSFQDVYFASCDSTVTNGQYTNSACHSANQTVKLTIINTSKAPKYRLRIPYPTKGNTNTLNAPEVFCSDPDPNKFLVSEWRDFFKDASGQFYTTYSFDYPFTSRGAKKVCVQLTSNPDASDTSSYSPACGATIFIDPAVSTTVPQVNAELTTIKTRTKDFIKGTIFPPSLSTGSVTLTKQNPDGSWSDLDYGFSAGGLVDHFDRIRQLMIGFKISKNSDFLIKINKAMKYGLTKTKENFSLIEYPWLNWYTYDIAIPNWLSQAALLASDDPNLVITDLNEAQSLLDTLINARLTDKTDLVGANALWRAYVRFYYGLSKGLESQVQAAKDRILLPEANIFVVPGLGSKSDGIKPDWSFHQHGPQLYSSGYGVIVAVDVPKYQYLTRGTKYALPQDKMDQIYNYVLQGLNWTSYRGNSDMLSIGRMYATEANYSTVSATAQIRASLLLYNLITSATNKNSLAGYIKELLPYVGENHYHLSSYGPLIADVKANSTPAKAVIGHKYYPYSDFTIQKGNNYALYMKTDSNKTIGYDSIGGKGSLGWHLGEGFTFLTLNNEYYSLNGKPTDVLPTLNWNKLPGTTVEQKIYDPNPDTSNIGSSPLAGGVEQNDYAGATAMEILKYNLDKGVSKPAYTTSLTAKKSWFFFENQIVALGSGINSASTFPVITTINQWPLPASSSTTPPLTGDQIVGSQLLDTNLTKTFTNPKWLHQGGIGYYFPSDQVVNMERNVQTGTWSSIGGPLESSTTRNNAFLNLWINHGVNAKNQSYAYVMLPDYTSDQTKAFAKIPPVTVLSNTTSLQAVKNNPWKILEAVFWQPGTIDQISVDKTSLAMYQISQGKLYLAVSEPTKANTVINVTLQGKMTPSSAPTNTQVTYSPYVTKLAIPVADGVTSKLVMPYLECESWKNVYLNNCTDSLLTSTNCQTTNKTVSVNMISTGATEYRIRIPAVSNTWCSDVDDANFSVSGWKPITTSVSYTFTNVGKQKICVQYRNTTTESPVCGGMIDIK